MVVTIKTIPMLVILTTIFLILNNLGGGGGIGGVGGVPADSDEDIDDLESEELLMAILGHANKKKPNKANIRNGKSDSAMEFMSHLYQDISIGDSSKNETKAEVDFFAVNGDDEVDGDGTRDKRNTKEVADTAITFITESFSVRPNITDTKGALFFDLRTDYDTSKNLYSELRMFFSLKRKAHAPNKFTIQVYEIYKTKAKAHLLVTEKEVVMDKYNSKDWVAINITKIVSKWFSDPTTNHGIFIRAKSKRGAALPLDQVGLITGSAASSAAEKHRRPFILVLLNTQQHGLLLTQHIVSRIQAERRRKKRKRRDVDFTELMKETKTKQMIRRARINFNKIMINRRKQQPDDPEKLACRGVPFHVDFKEMNWDEWVLAPKNYVSQRCQGVCSFPIQQQQNATSHALIQSLQNLISGGKYPEPCCAPYQMSPLHIFLLDAYANAVIKEYVDMKVDSCGCH